VRDLVNKPTERYNEMIDTIKYNDKYNDKANINKQDNMQDELSNFLQDLKKNNVSSDILSSNDGHSNTFSNY
jgi:dsDNA-binding SOS-regulon protein